jgi:hypothetical protein
VTLHIAGGFRRALKRGQQIIRFIEIDPDGVVEAFVAVGWVPPKTHNGRSNWFCQDFMAKEEKLTGNDLYRPLNLFKPRAYYVENLHGISESYQSDPLETAYRDALEKAVSRTDPLKVLPSELTHKKNNLLNLPIVRTWRWIAIRDSRSGGDQRTIVPVLVKVTRGEKPLRDMPDYYKAELTIARIVSKSQAGAVVVVYPRANDTIQAFMMSSDLSTLGEGERILRKAISSLRMAIEKHSIDNLDVCPSWAKPSYCGSCPESCTKLIHEKLPI